MSSTPALVEEGQAFTDLMKRERGARGPRPQVPSREAYDVVVVGGGQAGLSVGHYLAKRGVRFVILDASPRIGDSWRNRWDSLRLFTSAQFSGLAGLRFPAPPRYFPTKDEMADYLEAYAAHFDLPVRSGVRVERLYAEDGRYVLEAGDRTFEAHQVIVAMASYQRSRVPAFARELLPGIVQLHSSEYRSPAQLRDGPVLVAGAGNSGAEIAMDLRRGGRRVWMSGRDTGELPFRIETFFAQLVLIRLLLRVIFHRVLTVKTPMGRKVRPKILTQGGPLIRQKKRDLLAAGVERVARVAGARDGLPVLDDGRRLDVANVVWCTGFDPGLSWIQLPIFDAQGNPVHEGGVVKDAPGLYFVGQQFLYSLSSTMIHGVGRDAERVVDAVVSRSGSLQRSVTGSSSKHGMSPMHGGSASAG